MKTASKNYNIYFDTDLGGVVMKWTGYTTSGEFREGTELMLNILIKNNCKKVLADIKEMTLIGSDDQQWLENTFIPRAVQFGFKKLAIVRPSSYFNKVAIENVSEKIDKKNLTIGYFDTLEEATEWFSDVSLTPAYGHQRTCN
jgi:hypothetical protein